MPEPDAPRVAVIIPALNEEDSIARVIADIPRATSPDIIVVDNGCTDRTAERARAAGARVVPAPRRGYGSACMRGLAQAGNPDIVVFLDGDYSDDPREMTLLLETLSRGCDMVVGSRLTGRRERGALPPHSVWGNRLVCALINLQAGTRYTDLGPFRAVRFDKLMALGMKEPDYGWTVEMALRAAAAGWRTAEVPVTYRKRLAGRSKVTGSPVASVKTALKMFRVLFALRRTLRREPHSV